MSPVASVTKSKARIDGIFRYPKDIIFTTAVPAWAYLDVVATDKFNPEMATQAVYLPESTVGNNEGSITSSTASFSTSPLTPSSETLRPMSNFKSSHIPAIIGGTLGSILGLGLIILCLLKGSKRQSLSVAFGRTRGAPRTASQHAKVLPLSGCNSPNYRQRGPSPLPAGFHIMYSNGTPWSPPLPSITPAGATSLMGSQSLLSTQNHDSHSRRGGSTSSGLIDMPANSSSIGSTPCVAFSAAHKLIIATRFRTCTDISYLGQRSH